MENTALSKFSFLKNYSWLSQKIAAHWKNAVFLASLFLNLFAALFYFSNLDLEPKKETDPPRAIASAEAKLDDQLKQKIGASDISFLTYLEWSQRYELNSSNNHYDADPDKDGLSNYLEYVHLTNPQNPDTDADGYQDKKEILNGYDPDAKGDTQPLAEISINKISVQAPLIWSKKEDEQSLQEDLKNGIIHYPKTAAPGQSGNVILSGHSSNYVWSKGNYNYIFKDLNKLEKDDLITIKTIQQNQRVILYHYRVTEKNVTTADDQKIFEQTPQPTLTLSTCWPPGTNLKRLIVKASLVK